MKHYVNNNITRADYFGESFVSGSAEPDYFGANYYPGVLTYKRWIVWDKVKTDGLLSGSRTRFPVAQQTGGNIFRHSWEGFKKGAEVLSRHVSKRFTQTKSRCGCTNGFDEVRNAGAADLRHAPGSGSSAIAGRRFVLNLSAANWMMNILRRLVSDC